MIEENHFELKFYKCKSITHVCKNISQATCNELIFFPVNNQEINLDKSGINQVYCLLSNVYQNVPHNVCTTLKHKIVFEAIEEITKLVKKENSPFIELSSLKHYLFQYKDDNTEIAESYNNLEDILLDLNKLGVIVYNNSESLKNTIVVHPQWFNNVFKVILDNGKKRIQIALSKILKEILKLEKKENNIEKEDQEENSKSMVIYMLNWIKGDCSSKLSIEQIWSNPVEKSKSRVDKVTFEELSEKFHTIQLQMYKEEQTYEVFDKLKKKHQDVLHSLYTISKEDVPPMISVLILIYFYFHELFFIFFFLE